MIVLTPEESRDLDRRTIEAGTPSEVLMQRAAKRCYEVILGRFPLTAETFWVECGKGNNGADGRIIERLLRDAGATIGRTRATVVIDAVLGTGLRGSASGEALEQIRWIGAQRDRAKIVSIDIPSGLGSGGEHVTADLTVAIGTLKPAHVLPPWCDACGEVRVVDIGLLPAESKLHQLDPPAFAPRRRDSHKGDYGHVLVIGGAPGKAGAAAMAGLAALRAGAGWVTVTASTPYPELMTAPLDSPPVEGKSVVAIGPGLGLDHVDRVRELYASCPLPMIIDADALNSLAGWTLPRPPAPRILTPHPGEFRRLATLDDRLASARAFAETNHVTVVLKGYRTIAAHPDGRAYVNPTGSPALAKAGSGDILTGLIAGLYAQDPRDESVHAAVWLHGRCGELGERRWTDRCLIATDLLEFLPDAIRSAH
jgi:NAD(P)H-hydrate epimerase